MQRADPSPGPAARGRDPSPVLEAIHARRACRKFLATPVAETVIRELLDAAVQAPSAQNLQPWSFVVVEDRAVLQELCRDAKRMLLQDPHWGHELRIAADDFDIFYGAPLLVGICSQQQGFCPVGDCYLAGQNLMLAAHALGLASCPIGLARDAMQAGTARKLLQIPDGRRPVLPIAVGYPAVPMPTTRRHAPVIHAWLTRSG